MIHHTPCNTAVLQYHLQVTVVHNLELTAYLLPNLSSQGVTAIATGWTVSKPSKNSRAGWFHTVASQQQMTQELAETRATQVS